MTSDIDHVVVIALENRSFDHLFGYLDHPDPAFDGLRNGTYANPGWDGAPPVPATPDAKSVLPVGPDHSHDAVMEQLGLIPYHPGQTPTNDGFVASYERIGRGLSPPAFGGLVGMVLNWLNKRKAPPRPITGRGPLVMRCQPSDHIPALATLAKEFAVCTRWFCSVPGETWPNRNFLHAATSDGETNIDTRLYTNRTIFEVLEEHHQSWHIYYDDTPQVWAFVNLWTDDRLANWYHFSDFSAHVAAGTLPTYSFIEPNHHPPLHTLDHEPVIGVDDVSNSQHPGNNVIPDAQYDAYPDDQPDDFVRADQLVAQIYEALRANPEIFERTLLLITYDEHGGLYDHVPPVTGVPNPGTDQTVLRSIFRALYHRRSQAFDFTTLGPRVPAVVVSPHIPAGRIDPRVHDHASVPATLRHLFAPDAAPLTSRDAWAAPFHDLVEATPPRRGTELPSLEHLVGPPTSAARRVAGMPAAATGPAPASPATNPTEAPAHYQPYVDLADTVADHLRQRGATTPPAPLGTSPLQRASHASAMFKTEADRNRDAGSGTRPAANLTDQRR